MLIVALKPDMWMAFNPETCAMHKVWQGKMDFRGKVWDFSQDNSRAQGKIFLASPSELTALTDGNLGPWKSDGVTSESDGWTFQSTSSKLQSPYLDASGWQRVFVAFDETGKKGRFRIDILDRSGQKAPQWFESTTSVDSETNWQWNFKRIERPSKGMSVTVTSNVAGKRLRRLRLYGDRPSWFDSKGNALDVIWDGYELLNKTQALLIHYRVKLKEGGQFKVTHRPEWTAKGWREDLEVSGLPVGKLAHLRREGLSGTLDVDPRPSPSSEWVVQRNGNLSLEFDLPAGSQ